MDKKMIESFGRLLRNQRDGFLEKFRRVEEHLGSIAEDRESELEERAQEERSARLLASLDDRTVRAVQEIDAAFQRLVDGRYGICETCGKRILAARLRVLPATRFCKDCSDQKETKRSESIEEHPSEEMPLEAALP
jgi:RNA polymerase-binding protein DksA